MEARFRKIAVTGGAPVTLTRSSAPLGMDWSASGLTYSESLGRLGPDSATAIRRPGIYRIANDGASPELLLALEDGLSVYNPQILPDGDTLLFSTFIADTTDVTQYQSNVRLRSLRPARKSRCSSAPATRDTCRPVTCSTASAAWCSLAPSILAVGSSLVRRFRCSREFACR